MNSVLLEAFRHNSWATRQLLAFCRDLSEEQLGASATGTYGSVRATFNHLVFSDGRYLRRLAGGAPACGPSRRRRSRRARGLGGGGRAVVGAAPVRAGRRGTRGRRKGAELWVVFDGERSEVCRKDPGFDVELFVQAEPAAPAEWHLGRIEWADALRAERIRVLGSSPLARALPTENRRSPAADARHTAVTAS